MGRARDPFGGRRTDEGRGPVSIEVQNLNFNDATLFALRNGEMMRIGQITGKTNRTFEIEWTFARPLQFQADLVGGRSCRGRELPIDIGDRVWVRIPVNAGMAPCEVGKR